MDPSLYPSSNVRTLQDIAGAKPVHAALLDLPDHQPDAYPPSSAVQPDASAVMLPPFPIPAPTNATVANSNDLAVKEAWAKHQGVIEQLYLHENKTLAEVMRLMESEHGFKATVKMYKTYITKWGLDKKNKEPEMRAIVRKYKQRQTQGKTSTIRVRKRLQNFAEIVRYWERKGISIDDVIARQKASPTPEAVEVSTPVCSPILMPAELAIPERMLRCIRDYLRGSFESGTWVRTAPEVRCYSLKDKDHSGLMWPDFISTCDMACTLFEKGLFHEAGQTLNSATAKIKEMVSAEHPESINLLSNLVLFIRHNRSRDEIALSILRHFTAMSRVVLGSQHPLACFYECSVSVYASDFRDTVTKCIEFVSDEFASSVGGTHASTLISRMNLLKVMAIDGEARIQKLQKLFGECENTLRPDDMRVWWVRGVMADECFRAGRYDEAMASSQKNIVCSQDQSPMRRLSAGWYDQSVDLYVLARCQHALGEVDLGIATMCQAINLALFHWGLQDGRARLWLLVLEDWYVKQGLWDSAAQARERRLELLASIDTD